MFHRLKFYLTVWIAAAMFFAGALLPGAAMGAANDSLVFEAGADTPAVLAGERQVVTVRALVRPGAAARRRVPLAVALVLDKSGSMGGSGKMEYAKQGALEAIERLDARDVAAVVVYDNEAYVQVPAVSGSNKKVFSKAVSAIRPSGGTALYDGARLGAEQLRPFVGDGYVPRIVLLSDGLANVGPSSTHDLRMLGRALAEQEMTITTIGLGLDYNEDLMTALAAESGGNSYFAKRAESLSDIFAADMSDATTLTARKTKVTLTCYGGAKPIGAVGRKAYLKDAATLEASIDNVYGDEKYALFEIEIPAGVSETEGAADIAALKLEYLDPASESTVVLETRLSLRFVKDAAEVEKNRQGEIVSQAAIARNSEIREEAVRLADEGRFDDAAELLRGRTEVMMLMPASPMQAEIESEARELEELSESLAEDRNMSPEVRKSVLNKAYIQRNQQSGSSEGK